MRLSDLAVREWEVSYGGKSCQPVLVESSVKQNEPKLVFMLDDKKFFVEFQNRSDHMGASYGHAAEVTIISWNRSKRFPGIAVNKKVPSVSELLELILK